MDHTWVPDIPPRPHSSRVLKHGPASTFFLVVSNGMVGLVGLKSEIVWSNLKHVLKEVLKQTVFGVSFEVGFEIGV